MDNPDCGFKAMMNEWMIAGGGISPMAYHQIVLYPIMVLVDWLTRSLLLWKGYIFTRHVPIFLEDFLVKKIRTLDFSRGRFV